MITFTFFHYFLTNDNSIELETFKVILDQLTFMSTVKKNADVCCGKYVFTHPTTLFWRTIHLQGQEVLIPTVEIPL